MTIKIGIITDRYHLEKKMPLFLEYLKGKVEVSLYLEEDYVYNSSNLKFDEDIFFVKSKGDITLNLVKSIENEFAIPVFNSYRGIWLTMHRFMHNLLLKRRGIFIPEFSLNSKSINPNFKNYIVKNIIDQQNNAFNPKIEKVKGSGSVRVIDRRAFSDKIENDLKNKVLYYQEFIKSKWEYKVYGIGEQLLFYKQLPTLVNPNKMESRRKIDDISIVKEQSYKAMKILDLKITSIDFLKSKDGVFYLTDINSTPNFDYIKNGPKIVADLLIEEAKR
jgi:hypothetical protein